VRKELLRYFAGYLASLNLHAIDLLLSLLQFAVTSGELFIDGSATVLDLWRESVQIGFRLLYLFHQLKELRFELAGSLLGRIDLTQTGGILLFVTDLH